jgi:hypothetical protein
MPTDLIPTPMTTVQVPLSEAAHQQLRRRASEQGVPLEELARTVLEREAAMPPAPQSAEEWVAALRAWVSAQPYRELTVDDSRDAIYEGCGE